MRYLQQCEVGGAVKWIIGSSGLEGRCQKRGKWRGCVMCMREGEREGERAQVTACTNKCTAWFQEALEAFEKHNE